MTLTMMQPCASAAKLRGGGPILVNGIEAMVDTGPRHLEPSSATRRKSCEHGGAETVRCTFDDLLSLCRSEDDALRHDTIVQEVPKRDQQLAR